MSVRPRREHNIIVQGIEGIDDLAARNAGAGHAAAVPVGMRSLVTAENGHRPGVQDLPEFQGRTWYRGWKSVLLRTAVTA